MKRKIYEVSFWWRWLKYKEKSTKGSFFWGGGEDSFKMDFRSFSYGLNILFGNHLVILSHQLKFHLMNHAFKSSVKEAQISEVRKWANLKGILTEVKKKKKSKRKTNYAVKVGIRPLIPPREILKIAKITYFHLLHFIFSLLHILYYIILW